MNGKEAVRQKDKILYIEPNDLPGFLSARSSNGDPLDNITWNPDDLNIFVDLQVVIPSRQYNASELKEYGDFDFNGAKYQSILSGAKLGEPYENFLTDDWTAVGYQEIKSNRAGSRELLGINSIQITFDSHMYPVVTMNFTDVRGSSLMQPQEQRYLDLNGKTRDGQSEATKNFFASVFKFPYPRFLLSVKGVYGTCVTFVLSVSDFKSSFNSDSGNFDITIKFIGNMYGLYTDIPMNYILIAPYIGSKIGGYTKNEYWESQTGGGSFRYSETGAQGAPILTFLEFYSMYSKMTDDGDISDAFGANLEFLGNANREIAMLKGSDGIIPQFYDKLPNMVKPAESSGEPFAIIDDSNLSVNALLYDTNVKQVEIDDDFARQFKDAVDAYKKEFPNGFFAQYKDNGPYHVISGIYNGRISSIRTSPAGKGNWETSFGRNRNDVDALEKLKDEIAGNVKSAVIYEKTFKTAVSDYVNNLNAECERRYSGASEEMRSHFKGLFGFTPTIENVMRMLFAHIDTFIHYFYKTVTQIDGSRTLKTLGDFDKALTDIESSSGQNAHVPPFTGFFRETGERKVERMYPGDDTRTSGIVEVGFVEDILNGISAMDEWQKQYMNTDDDNEEDGEYSLNFKPSMVSDVFYNGENPYDSLRSDATAWDTLYFFLCRYYQYAVSTGRVRDKKDAEKVVTSKKFIENEIDNFVSGKQFKKFAKNEKFRNTVKTELKYGISQKLGEIAAGKYPIPFSFRSFPTYELVQKKFAKWVVSPKGDKLPMVCNGIAPPSSDEYDRNNKEGFNIEGYDEKYLEKFSDSLESVGLSAAVNMDFDYEYYKFARTFYYSNVGGSQVSPGTPTMTQASNSEVIPVNKHENGYYPYTERDGKGGRKIYTEKPFDYYKSDKVLDRGENELGFSSYDDFLKNGNADMMWMPSVLGKVKKTYGTGYDIINVLVPFSNNPLFRYDGRSAALFFLRSLFLGKNTELGDSSFADSITAYFSTNIDRCIKMMRAEYLLFCGIAYATSSGNVIDSEISVSLGKSRDAVVSAFTGNEIAKMAECFTAWADDEFPSIISAISGLPRSTVGTKYRYTESNGVITEATTDMDEYGGVSDCRSQLNNMLVNLYRQTVIVMHIGHVESGTSVWIDDSDVVDFFSGISKKLEDSAEKLKNDDDGNTAGNIKVSINFNDDSKNVVYYTLKNLYDRWLSMLTHEDFTLHSPEDERRMRHEKMVNGERLLADRSEFNNFIYVDSFYNDISKKYPVNPEKLFKLIGSQFDGTMSYNILDFIGKICQDNKLLFRCLPVYSNVYSIDTFAEIFTPHSLYDGTSRTGRRIGNTYMLMYTYEPSHFLDIEQDKSDGVNYGNDSFDIADSFGDITQESLEVMKKKNGDDENNYSVCAFGVTAAKQNQSYFTKINVGMDSPRVTDFSIMNKFQLADMARRGGTANGMGVGQDLYSVYSNRSYDCSVEMLGCANIMPMMYFQLNNVPMFKGAYMITKVEHNISNNNMVTKFTGTRQPKRYVPIVENVFNTTMINEAVSKIASRNGNVEVSGGTGTVAVRADGTKETVSVRNPEVDGKPYNSSFPKGSVFYAWAAVKQIFGVFKRQNGEYARSAEKGYTSNCGRCATAVQTFLMAGFNGYVKSDTINEANIVESKRLEKGFSGCNGYEMWNCLKDYGFDVVATLSTIDSVRLQAGDVCVTKKYKGSSTPIYPGHVCMYVGKEMGGFWASDFRQNSWWVYGAENKKYLNESDVLVFRFMGTISTEEKYFG